MAYRINSNIAALNALRHLHDTEEALSTNLEPVSYTHLTLPPNREV